jgi:hypothetical protein
MKKLRIVPIVLCLGLSIPAFGQSTNATVSGTPTRSVIYQRKVPRLATHEIIRIRASLSSRCGSISKIVIIMSAVLFRSYF